MSSAAFITRVAILLCLASDSVLELDVSWWLLTGAFNSGVISFALASPIGLGIFDTIIAAGVFTAGMKAIGLTDALIVAMKNSQSIAKLAASYGPFIIAILGGSGDAATLAFNGAITPHAKSFGMGVAQMGSLAQLSGALGRTMSPVAGAAIVCAQIAKVNPMEMSKRTALPMVVTATVIMFLLS